jgi:hypothetical protein
MDEHNPTDETVGGQQPPTTEQRDLQSDERKNRKSRRERWIDWTARWGGSIDIFFNAIVTLFTVAVGITTILQWPLAQQALEETRESNRAMADQLAEMKAANDLIRNDQRPLIAFGDESGQLAQYFPPKGNDTQGKILVYFRNVGSRPARHFMVDAHATWRQQEFPPLKQARLVRYQYSRNGEPVATALKWRGATLAPESRHDKVMLSGSVPTPREWKEIERGKRQYEIFGTFEYCDDQGRWVCERYSAEYDAPVGRFVRGWDPRDDLPCEPYTEVPAGDPEITIEIVAPCESPKERAEREAAQ